MKRASLLVMPLAVGLALSSSVAHAHPLAPSALRLVEAEDGLVTLRFRTPMARPVGTSIEPVIPDACAEVGQRRVALAPPSAVESTVRLRCEGGIVGKTFGARGLAASGTDVLWEARRADGSVASGLLHAGSAHFEVPARARPSAVLADYLRLGVEHFATGTDHVLFVLALLFVLARRRALFIAITAFTIGHSVSLALAALDVVRLPQGPVEVAIAASILVLALELGAPRSDETQRPIERHPALIPGAFGLLHGRGFAGVLLDAGLPVTAIPHALLGFNVGIELAQLALVAVALLVVALARRISVPRLASARSIASYAIGSVAAMWILERSGLFA
jgi:hypothetical protein